jgi:Xaa-Pro aminopeptidase
MSSPYQQRRQALAAQLGTKALMIVGAASRKQRKGDVLYPFCQDSDFYYLTGFPEADAIMVVMPGHVKGPFILFCHDHDPMVERWEGPRIGHRGAVRDYGANQVYALADFPDFFKQCLQQVTIVYCPFRQEKFVHQIRQWLVTLQDQARAGVHVAHQLHDSMALLHEQRLLKDPSELSALRQAAAITAQGFARMMTSVHAGMYEYQLEAEFLYALYQQGVREVAYPSIVAGGKNACILHYSANHSVLEDGDLVLVDAGAEYQGYAADVTRTFPVNGRFSAPQKAIYLAVLAVQERAIAAIKPGVTLAALQSLAALEMTQQLVRLGLLKGSVQVLLKKHAYQKFFMHGLGHWLGLDVHDVGSVHDPDGASRALVAGMVLTVEPGIYIDPQLKGVAVKWLGIGVRIEDDVLVTDKGGEVLTQEIVKDVQGIESFMGSK